MKALVGAFSLIAVVEAMEHYTALLREDFDKWSKVFSMFVFQPFAEETALIYHLDGRKYKTDDQRKELGWGKNACAKDFMLDD